MKIFAIIPARGGSKGVPKKNIRSLEGYPLIAYSIAAATLAEKIERVIVSTDSEEIASVAKSFGAEVPFLRPDKYAADLSPDDEFVLHALHWFHEHEGEMPDYLVHLRPTTPLREPQILDEAIAVMLEDQQANSLRSGHLAAESPFKWLLRDEQGYFKTILPEYTTNYCNLPRQTFPPVYIPDGYVDILKTEFILQAGVIHGEKMIGFASPVCHEVDTIEDFAYLEFEAQRKGSMLLDYLKEHFPQED